jgi:hypothetical protein
MRRRRERERERDVEGRAAQDGETQERSMGVGEQVRK